MLKGMGQGVLWLVSLVSWYHQSCGRPEQNSVRTATFPQQYLSLLTENIVSTATTVTPFSLLTENTVSTSTFLQQHLSLCSQRTLSTGTFRQ